MLGIEIGAVLNAAGFSQGMQNVQRSLSKFGNEIIGKFFGIEALKGIAGAVKDAFVEAFNDLKEIKLGSLKTGLDKETFQTVRNALEAAGSSADGLATALTHVAVAMEAVEAGGTEGAKAARAFAELGIEVSDLQTKSRQQIFFQMADGLRAAANAGTITEAKLASLKTVLGKGAVEFIPFIARGTDNILDSLTNKSEEQLKALTELKKAWMEMVVLWKVAKETAVEAAPKIASLIAPEWAKMGYKAGRNFILGDPKEREEQEQAIAKMLAKVTAQRSKKAIEQADQRAADDATQSRREKIAQLEFERDEALEKALPKEEQRRHILEKIAELQGMKPADDETRARLEATIAELQGQQKSLEGAAHGGDFKQQVNELQRIGAAVFSPRDDSNGRQQVQHLQKIAFNSTRQTQLLADLNRKDNDAFA